MQNLLITGGEHQDRVNHAIKLVQGLMCLNELRPCQTCKNCQRITSQTHPNFVYVSPPELDEEISSREQTGYKTSSIKIEQVRQIVIESYKTNFESGPAIFLITHMHKTTASAANALLKIIEENRPNKIFIALAPSRLSVLPTIASRLINYRIKPAPLDVISGNNDTLDAILKINHMPVLNRIHLCEEYNLERETLIQKFHTMSHICHLMLRTNTILPRFALKILEALARARLDLQRNLNPRLVVERLFLQEWPH